MADNIKGKDNGERQLKDTGNKRDPAVRRQQEIVETREQPVNGLDAPPGAQGVNPSAQGNPAENKPPYVSPASNPGLNSEPKRIGNIPPPDNRPVYPERRKELMDDYEEEEIVNQTSADYPQDDIDREDIDRETDPERYFLNSDIDKSFMNSRFYPDRSSFRNQTPFHRR